MKMEESIRDSLANFEAAFDENAWNSIESKVNENNQRFKKKKWLSSGAAVSGVVVVLGWAVWFGIPSNNQQTLPQPKSEKQHNTTVAINDKENTHAISLSTPLNEEAASVIESKTIDAKPAKEIPESVAMLSPAVEVAKPKLPLIAMERTSICMNEFLSLSINTDKVSYIDYGNGLEKAQSKHKINFNSSGKHKLVLYSGAKDNATPIDEREILVNSVPDNQFQVLKDMGAGRPEVGFKLKHEIKNVSWYVDNDKIGDGPEAEHIFNSKGQYSVKVVCSSEQGCMDSSTQSVRILRAYNLMATSVFDPSKDEWMPLGLKKPGVDFELKIVSDKGEVVFTSNDPSKGWDGKINGSSAEKGELFVWLARVKRADGSIAEYGDSFLITSLE